MKNLLFLVFLFASIYTSAQEYSKEQNSFDVNVNLLHLSFGVPNLEIELVNWNSGFGASYYYYSLTSYWQLKLANTLYLFGRYYMSKEMNSSGVFAEASLNLVKNVNPIPSLSIGYKKLYHHKSFIEVFLGVGVIESNLLIGNRIGLSVGKRF